MRTSSKDLRNMKPPWRGEADEGVQGRAISERLRYQCFCGNFADKNHAAKAKAMPDEAEVKYILSCRIDQKFAP